MDTSPAAARSTSKPLVFALVVLLLLTAFLLRIRTLWSPHWHGGQSIYAALAMKWNNDGIVDYNLNSVVAQRLPVGRAENLYMMILAARPGAPGFVDALAGRGWDVFRRQPFPAPPFFPALIREAHSFFLKPLFAFTVLSGEANASYKLWINGTMFRLQSWITVIPLLASLSLIAVAFFLARAWFGTLAGVLAGCALVTNPVDMLASNQALPHTLAAALIAFSAVTVLAAERRRSHPVFFCAGLLSGLAVLTSYTALLFLPAVATMFLAEHRLNTPKRFLTSGFVTFFAGFFFIATQWFVVVRWDFFFSDVVAMARAAVAEGWAPDPHSRPLSIIYYPWTLVFLSPPLLLAVGSLRKKIFLSDNADKIRFLWFWCAPFLIFFLLNPLSKDIVNLLPILVPLSLLSSYSLRDILKPDQKTVSWFLLALLSLSYFWSIYNGVQACTNLKTWL